VIGSGQAGPFLAVRLAQAGMKTALIPTLLEKLAPLTAAVPERT
jgi:2-polyprenyl-6-methoxyphenol hydroxylase-like FAD-dependent oxidoreductase